MILPYWKNTNWFKKLSQAPDIALVLLSTPLSFYKGPTEEISNSAPFQTLVALIGFKKSFIKLKNHKNGYIHLNFNQTDKPQPLKRYKNLLNLHAPRSQKVTPTSFLTKAKNLHNLRQKTVVTIKLDNVSLEQNFQNDFCLVTKKDSFELAKEHLFSTSSGKRKKIPLFVLNKQREQKGENWKLWDKQPSPCIHCHNKYHETHQCFAHTHSKTESPIKSLRLRKLTKWFRQQKIFSNPHFQQCEGQGQNLLDYLDTTIIPRAHEIKIAANNVCNMENLFPNTFSKIRNNFHFYMALGFKHQTLDHILRGWSPAWIKEPPKIEITHCPIQEKFQQDVLEADKTHLESGRISEVPESFLHYIAPRFAVDQSTKSKKKIRTIWNGRHLSPFLPHRPFKLPTLKKLKGVLSGYLTSIDLLKAYFQFPLAWEARRFFGFRSNMNQKKTYCFNNIPFGLSTAPAIFQNFSQEVANIISRLTGWKIYVYLDDFLIQISETTDISKEELENRVNFILRIFELLGLQINKKSDIFPATELKWIGAYVNTFFKTDFPTIERIEKFLSSIHKIQQKPFSTLEEYQELRGLFTNLAPPHARFIARPIDDIISRELTALPTNPKIADYKKIAKNKIPQPIFFKDLCSVWYDDIILSLNINLDNSNIQENFIIVSDASEQIGGAFCFNKTQSNNFLRDPVVSKDITKHSFQISPTIQTTPEQSTRTKTSSFIRELDVLVTAAKIFEEKWSSLNPKENRLVFYLDNLGLTWALQKESFHDHQSIELFSTLKNITNRFKTLFLWHPRDTEAAKLADYMSKIPEVQFTENISSDFKINITQPTMSIEESLLITKLSTKTLKGNSVFIHPCTPLRQIQTILDFLVAKNFKGYLFIPEFPSKTPTYHFAKKYIGRIPFTHEYFQTDKSILNRNIFISIFSIS